ncbi:hypothetical protein M9Y10_041072 [Tritrichomonas musculus]|uniref:Vps16 N-terminal domain-containing protein n=1 Tax=Tritrichomonas musculus TaxID=1915356 RepID=A0ABR2K3D7_9EUKA
MKSLIAKCQDETSPFFDRSEKLLNGIVDEIKTFEDNTFVTEKLLQTQNPSNSFFSQNINFEYDMIRIAADGGSIAVIHKAGTEMMMHSINLYDSCLNHINQINLKTSSQIQNFYLTAEEMIVVVYDSTEIEVYDQRGNLIVETIVCPNIEFVIYTAFLPNGFFLVTFAGKVYFVSDFSKLNCISVFCEDLDLIPAIQFCVPVPAEPDKHGPILWGFAEIASNKQTKQLLLCIQENNIQTTDFSEKILNITFSANYQMAAVLLQNSLIICTADFQSAYNRLILEKITVKNITWCGNSTILLNTNKYLLMVGDSPTVIKWPMPGGCYVSNEVDGARIITADNIFYLREISGVPLDFVYYSKDKTKGGKSPAFTFFQKVERPYEFTQSDPCIKIGNKLPEAINGCLEASKFFRKQELVKELLKIVSRYKDDIPNYDSKDYSRVLSHVRVISHLSMPPINMPLTEAQLAHLGHESLVVRLCNRFLHIHAYKIADYLGTKTETIAAHWANCLIRSHASNDEIMKRLRTNDTTIDFVELATIAFELAEKSKTEEGRRSKEELALELAKCVKVKSRTVPLLIRRGQWAAAVEAAVNSNDTSLLVFVLKSATEKQQDDLVRNCITEHRIALDGWLKLHPNDPMKSELLEKSGLTRQSILMKFDEGEPLKNLRDKAKQSKDSFNIDLIDRIDQLSEICKELDIPYNNENINTMTAYDVFDKVLETGDPKKIKNAISILKFSSDEVLSRKVNFAIQTGNTEILHEAAKKAKQSELPYVLIDLAEQKRENEARILLEYISNEETKDRCQQIIIANSASPQDEETHSENN